MTPNERIAGMKYWLNCTPLSVELDCPLLMEAKTTSSTTGKAKVKMAAWGLRQYSFWS